MIASRCPQEEKTNPLPGLFPVSYFLLLLSFLESWVKRESVGLKIYSRSNVISNYKFCSCKVFLGLSLGLVLDKPGIVTIFLISRNLAVPLSYDFMSLLVLD